MSCFAKAAFMAAFFLLGMPATVWAGMVEVRPTTFVITPSQRTAVLSVTNPDSQPVVYQIRAYRWLQKGGDQTLEPTSDLIASPPIISLQGKTSQTVRIGLRSKDIADNEQTYRLILEEIPAEGASRPAGLNVMLRLSLPVFVRQQSDTPPEKLSAILRQVDGRTLIKISNQGQFTARITRLRLQDGDRPENSDLVYILPGGWHVYTFNSALLASLQQANLTLQTGAGDVDLKAPLSTEASSDATPPALP